MLDRIEAAHFEPLTGGTCELQMLDGERVTVRVDAVTLKPLAQIPEAPAERRVPFSVVMTALQDTAFVDGWCNIDLPQLGTVEGIRVSRVAPLGRDPSRAYFQILFN